MVATPSEVATGLAAMAETVAAKRLVLKKAIQNTKSASDDLTALPVEWKEVIDTIQAYPGDDAAQLYAKAQLAALTSEFLALQATLNEIAAKTPK